MSGLAVDLRIRFADYEVFHKPSDRLWTPTSVLFTGSSGLIA